MVTVCPLTETCLFFSGFVSHHSRVCRHESIRFIWHQIVFNPTTYPNFLRFLDRYPDIALLPTEMTFSVSRDHGVFEWAGNNLAGVFCQPSRLLDPNMWRLLYDILRFNACARELVVDGNYPLEDCPVAEYLAREGYSDTFRDDYLIVSFSS